MAITFPYDVLVDFPGWSVDYELLWRQEQSRTAGGQTIVKDLGSPLWQATYQSSSLSINELDRWRARLRTLENGLNQFKGYPLSRCFPVSYPLPIFPTALPGFSGNGAVNSINANRKAISIKTFPATFKLVEGDMLRIGTRNLHQVVEAVTANGSGVSSQFEIRPHLWPETVVNDVVSVINPFCLMTLVPGSMSSTTDLATGTGSITFQAIESR